MNHIYLSARRRFLGFACLIILLVSWLSLGVPRVIPNFPVIPKVSSAPTIEQSAYRFFANTDTTNVGSPLAANNTAATLSYVGEPFRMRLLLHIGVDTMPFWEPQAVAGTGNVGLHTSIDAVDAETVFVSYYDATNGDLKVAKTVNGGTSWTIFTVDSTGDVGQYSGITVVDSATVFVSYYDATNGDLKVAYTTDGGTNWTTTSPDTGGIVGQYSAIDAYDANTAYISYYDATNGDIKVAKTTNGGSGWTLYTPETTNNIGQYTSIQTLNATTAYLSYYDVTNGDARFSKTVNGGASWSSFAVTAAPFDVGRYTSIAAADTDTIYVAMYHVTNQDLRVNKSTDGGTSWAGSNIDSTGDVGQYTSIKALDVNTVYASYYDATNGNLKLATTTNGGGTFAFQTIETANDVGQYSSLVIKSLTVAFASYYDVTNADLRVASFTPPKLKLQYAQRGSDNQCDTSFTNETYADVTAATPIAYYDNPSVADGDALTGNLNDPTHSGHFRVNQTYEEANPFSSSVAIISAGQDGKWDFALADSGSMSGTTFCLRAVKNDGSLLDSYSVVPQVSTSTNVPPNPPTNLRQRRVDTLEDIPVGGWVTNPSIRFSGVVTDPDVGQSVRLCIRILTLEGALVRRQCSGYGAQGSVRTIEIPSNALVEGHYQWEAQGEDISGAESALQCFPDSNCNQTGARDIGVDQSAPSISGAVVRDGTGSDIDTQQGTSALSANWSGFSDTLSGINRYEFKIVRDSDGKCLELGINQWVDCDSWTSNGASTSFTRSNIPIAVGHTYSVGVRAIDEVGFVSGTVSSDGVTLVAVPPPSPPPPPVIMIPIDPLPTGEPPPTDKPPATVDLPSFKTPVSTVTDALQNLRQVLKDSPVVQQVVTTVTPIAAPATATTGIIVLIAQFLSQGPVYLSYLWTIILEYLGVRRRRRSWGTVYNAETKDPLPMVVVQLIDRATGQVVEQRVTDQQGRFGFLPKAGTYRIQVIHPGYDFPSKIVRGKGDFRFADVYHGEDLTIKEQGTALTVNIPLDSVGVEVPETFRFVPRVSFRRVSTIFLLIALLMQAFTAIVQPSPKNIGLIVIYVAALSISRLMLHRRKPKNWAAVYDVDTKEEVAGAEIYITEEGNPRFGSRRVTDDSGRAYLLLPPGRYHLFVNHPNYHFPIADEIPGYKGEVIVVTKENPLIHIDIPVRKEENSPTSPLLATLATPTNGNSASVAVELIPGEAGK